MISNRAKRLSPSETLKISAKAKELAREGRSIVSLSAGEPDFKTPDHICKAAIQAIEDGFHGYTMNTGTPELRDAIVRKLKEENGLQYDSTEIVVSNGAKQSIGFTMLALLDPEDEVIIPSPYWVSYPEMVKLADGVPVPLRTTFENNFKLQPADLEKAITEKTKAVILCSPSNPTGACYSPEELKAIATVLEKHPGIVIISDEIYEYIVFDQEHTGILSVAPGLQDRTILINGFSKGFAMTGWRLGYLAAPSAFASAVAKIQSQETSAPSSISQKAGEAAYNGSREPIMKMKEAFRERRDYMYQALSEMDGIRCFKPGGAFYIFPDCSSYFGKKSPTGDVLKNSTDLCLYLLEEHGVAAVPGDAFGEPAGIRLSYATSMDQLQEAIRRLKKGFMKLT
ncbi:MAG: pyridoxal phosphate-dependent aminotransferase [Balneolaceae bacterium]